MASFFLNQKHYTNLRQVIQDHLILLFMWIFFFFFFSNSFRTIDYNDSIIMSLLFDLGIARRLW